MKCLKCKRDIPDNSMFCNWCGKKQAADPQRKALKRANGTGTVYRLQGRRRRPWVAARSKVIIGYYEKKTDALEALGRLSGRDITERYNMTFSDVYEAWKEEHFRTIGDSGKNSYSRAYDVFAPLHDRKFRGLKTADFQNVIDQHLHKSHSTVSKYKQLITQMSQWAMREEIITTNLASFVRLPDHSKKEKEIFTDADIAKLEADNSETAKIILMLIYTGMRIGELFHLPLDNYHKTYVIGGSKTEAGKNRVIPIRPEGQPYFAYFAEHIKNPGQLISGYTGDKVIENFRRRNYYPLLKKLGIEKKTPHAARHTFASWAVRQGISPEILQKVLGHAKYTTTADIYVHADIDQLVNAISKKY